MSKRRSITRQEGFGSNLRLQLDRLGVTQETLAETAKVSRATISRAINHDEVSPTTEEKIHLALARLEEDTSVSNRSHTRAETGERGSRRLLWATLCSVSDLEEWAESRAAQAELPRLVRRLIRFSGRRLTRLSMRAGDSVGLGGWDGLTESADEHPWIPRGQAGWEMGVGKDPKRKATEDIKKRSESPGPVEPRDTTFVFVTPRRWESKDDWAREVGAETEWKDVRVIDGDDLETWLTDTPAVHVWLSRLIGTLPEGVSDLEGFWEAWSLATSPPVSEKVLSAGREKVLSELREHLHHGTSPLTIAAESRDEAIAMVYCAAKGFEPEAFESFLSRCMVLDAEGSLRGLSGHPEPLVLIARASVSAEAIAAARRAGHLMILPREHGDEEAEATVSAPSVARLKVAELLQEEGIGDEESRRLAGLARRSMSAFRRHRSVAGNCAIPGWARPDVARTVLPALLLGEWNERFDGDREALATLSRASFDDAVDSLIPWTKGHDPVLRRRDTHWYLVSREDSWYVLAEFLRKPDLERLSSLAIKCFSELDPSLELPSEKRWMAGMLTGPPRFSVRARRGIAGTLALLGARGESDPHRASHAAFASHTVRRVLEGAGDDWKRWASLSPVLPRLAEAAPDVFLEMVEEGTSGEEPVLRTMFSDGRESGFFGPSSPHSHLLWALERLAWSPLHLSTVCVVLASLDRIDPGSPIRSGRDREGRFANRPFSSLASVFRSWLPQTSVPLESRLDALDYLSEVDPTAAWAVALSMLPERHGSATPNATPEFREWQAEPFRKPRNQEVVGAWRGAFTRLLRWVGTDGPRWNELIQTTDRLPREYVHEVLDQLSSLDPREVTGEARRSIWESLRDLVARHRKFRNADWALPAGTVGECDGLRLRFQPDDLLPQALWLFRHDPDLPDGSPWDESSFEERREALAAAREDAVAKVISAEGKEGVLAMVDQVEDAHALGYTLGQLPQAEPIVDDLIVRFLSPQPSQHSTFALGLALGRVAGRDDGWLDSAISGAIPDLTPDQKGVLLLLKPAGPETWSLVDSAGEGASESYWRSIRIYSIPAEHIEEAASRLLTAKRPFSAVELLSMHLRRKAEIPTKLVIDVLTAATEVKDPADGPRQGFSYALGLLLDELGASDADLQEVARLEWATLPAVSSFERTPKVLHRFMAEEPGFFVELVRLAFRAEGEEPQELDESTRNRADMAYQLLESWRAVPGGNDKGRVDEEALFGWLKEARELLEDEGRLSSGDRIIGQVFSRIAGDPDGTFPPSPVRRAIEKMRSSRIEEGLYLGIVNGRGVTSRLPQDGGKQERALAEKYEGLAMAISASAPRTSRVLQRVARSYRQQAAREDLAAELGEDTEA